MRILLVEDNTDNAQIFVRILRGKGYPDVVCKTTGVEGLQLAQQETFDLFLVDFDLPDISGLHVGLALHTMMQRKQLNPAPLIALTAQSDKLSQSEALCCGFDAFIGKPCTDADLLGVIQQLLKK